MTGILIFCFWKKDKDHNSDDFYKTVCGEAFYFGAGDIIDNKYVYCPYCGKKIKELK